MGSRQQFYNFDDSYAFEDAYSSYSQFPSDNNNNCFYEAAAAASGERDLGGFTGQEDRDCALDLSNLVLSSSSNENCNSRLNLQMRTQEEFYSSCASFSLSPAPLPPPSQRSRQQEQQRRSHSIPEPSLYPSSHEVQRRLLEDDDTVEAVYAQVCYASRSARTTPQQRRLQQQVPPPPPPTRRQPPKEEKEEWRSRPGAYHCINDPRTTATEEDKQQYHELDQHWVDASQQIKEKVNRHCLLSQVPSFQRNGHTAMLPPPPPTHPSPRQVPSPSLSSTSSSSSSSSGLLLSTPRTSTASLSLKECFFTPYSPSTSSYDTAPSLAATLMSSSQQDDDLSMSTSRASLYPEPPGVYQAQERHHHTGNYSHQRYSGNDRYNQTRNTGYGNHRHQQQEQQRRRQQQEEEEQYYQQQQQRQAEEEKMQIEVEPGYFLPLRGSDETIFAVETGTAITVQCFACEVTLQCVPDCELVICPDCRVLSPLSLFQDSNEDDEAAAAARADSKQPAFDPCSHHGSSSTRSRNTLMQHDSGASLKSTSRRRVQPRGVGLGLKLY